MQHTITQTDKQKSILKLAISTTNTQLYNSQVQPVIDYGAALWETRDFSSIKSVQYKAGNFSLVFGNTILLLRKTFPEQAIELCITRTWCRMSLDRINS